MDIIIRRRSIVLILFLVFLFSTQNYFILSLGTMNIICKPSERRALLSFKQHLNDSYSNSLSSWSGENCCSSWAGVICSNTTHHVVQLHLQRLRLSGELNPSLQELKQLRHLDLSSNDFDRISIPVFFGSLLSLRYLNLSRAVFSGMIPHQLGNLSNLRYLDLSFNYGELSVVGNFQWISNLSSLKHLDLSGANLENASDFQWISHLSSLEHLDLSDVNLKNASDFQWISHLSSLKYLDLSWVNLENASDFQWISHLSSLEHLDLSGVSLENASSNWFHDVVNMLPSLLVLRLFVCDLSGALPTSLSHVNFTSLQVLDLSNNKLNSSLPEWLYSLANLQQLDLSWNSFQGTISPSIGNLTKLTLLDLSYNEFEGEIPITLGNLCKLHELDLMRNKLKGEISGFLGGRRLKNLNVLSLGENHFSGPIPLSIGRLSLLERLDLRDNKLNGSLPESLGNLSKLGTLDITNNAFEGGDVVVSEVHFVNLTNLQYLFMNSIVIKMSPEWIPPFQLVSADLRTCQLGPGFPVWLRTQKNLTSLYLSRTGISGTIPTWFWNFTTDQFITLDLSHNELNGELPKVINATTISLKSNQFSGQLPRLTPDVQQLDLSNNSFSGPISTFLCNHPISENHYLLVLDLSDNLLSGNLSDCWVYWESLMFLNLEGNKITGNIPNSMSSLFNLEQLHLSNNNLSGELPSSLRNCTSLTSIDLGENGFTGRLPIWLGETLSGLQYLRLRSNKFYGEIPLELCHLASIQVLDIAHNDLRGSIPRCFNNFSVLTTKKPDGGSLTNDFGENVENTQLVVKGRELEYSSIGRELVTSLDLSKNSLSGEIPEELTSLLRLILLNLSDNYFTGKIPEKMGNMTSLESLDLSRNRISGVIPQSISGLYSLSHLNLSYNNLSGIIPSGTQLQSFNESSFVGNQDLCGLPLNKCNVEEPPQKPDDIGDRADEDEDWFEMKWFYMSMGVGFVFGFWVFCGVLVCKKSWRFAYFQFLDDMKDKLCTLV